MTKAAIKAAAVRLRNHVRDMEVELDRRTVTWMAVLAGTLGLAVGAIGTCGGPAVADERAPVAAPAVVISPESVIELRFTEHEQLSGRGLDARVEGRVAVLTGTVKTEADRALAGKLAAVEGVDRVENQLQLEPPPKPLTRQARANLPLTRDERERRKRPGGEASVAAASVAASEAALASPAAAVPAVAQPATVEPSPAHPPAPPPVAEPAAVTPPKLTPGVAGALAVPPGPATGLAAGAPAPAGVEPAPSPSQILGEAVPPSPSAALPSPLAADDQ